VPDSQPSNRDLRISQLQTDLNTITTRYDSFITGILTSLINRGVYTGELSTYLLTIPAFSRGQQKKALMSASRHELERAAEVGDMLLIMTSTYASFLDYDLLQTLLKRFDIDDGQECLQYPEHLLSYANHLSIREFIEIKPVLGQVTDSSKKLTLKVDIQLTNKLAHLRELRDGVAEILDITPSALRLLDIEDGCVVVTFQIHGSVEDVIFAGDKKRVFSPQQMEDFRSLAVCLLKWNSYEWDFSDCGTLEGMYGQ